VLLTKSCFDGTDTDSRLERRYLWSTVVPQLRKQFQYEWDVEFQVSHFIYCSVRLSYNAYMDGQEFRIPEAKFQPFLGHDGFKMFQM